MKGWPKEIEDTLLRCATCGLIRGTTDPATHAAIYSVMIESPQLGNELCACRDDDPASGDPDAAAAAADRARDQERDEG